MIFDQISNSRDHGMAAFAHALTFFCTRDLALSERFYGGTLGLAVAMRTPTAIVWRVNPGAFFGVTAGPGREPKAGAALLDLTVGSAAEVTAILRDPRNGQPAPDVTANANMTHFGRPNRAIEPKERQKANHLR
jgi:hypothetical protein